MNEQMKVTFWGVRGSHPTPGTETVRFGGNTACVEVNAGPHTIIFDAGTGIIPLGKAISRRAKSPNLVVLFSHLHHDHTQGFPFFAPAYNPAARLWLFGPGAYEQALGDLLAANQMPPAFPVTLSEMNAWKEMHSLHEMDVVLVDERGARLERQPGGTDAPALRIRSMKSYAHPGGVLVYRVEWAGLSLVYATDTEGYIGTDRRLAAFAQGADLLIHDAQYSEEHYRGLLTGRSTQGFGHSTPQMACELAAAAGVGQLALFHHDPNYDDATLERLEGQAKSLFPAAFSAREGLTVTLTAGHQAQWLEAGQIESAVGQ